MKYQTPLIIAVLLLAQHFASTLAVAKTKQASTGRTVAGVVTHVTDGDTLWVKPLGGGEALDVRLQGIDAPESCQDYGRAAQQQLAAQVMHRTVTLTTKARDKYGRVIAKVSLGQQDVGAWMVANGHAWSYHFHRSAGPYAREEAAARQAGRGLWATSYPLEPRAFRKRTSCRKQRK
jgi:micrococcal nuclease